MKKVYIILLLHIILVMLASSNFTIISFFRENVSFHWNYGGYSYRNGFGYIYVSEYSLLQILTYIAAYLSGLVLFTIAICKGLKIVGLFGLGLCGIGLTSFLIEGSHWIFQHHLSWIASFPIVLIFLWLIIIISIFKLNKQAAEET